MKIPSTASFFKSSLILSLAIASLFVFSCIRSGKFPAGKKVVCDAELTTPKGKFIASNDSLEFFDGGYFRSDLDAFTGKYSALTIPKTKAFAFGYSIKDAGPDQYFEVSVWRKSKDGKGVLVASSEKKDIYYLATAMPVEKNSEGWEKLMLEVYTPPNFGFQGLKFYVWNNGSDTVFFDQMVIERLERKNYPDFSIAPFAIMIDSSDMLKLQEKRIKAFDNGILESSDNDWVKGFIFSGNEPMKAKFRLKGDWLDHLRGDKWSFRVKMRKDYAWNRLRAFSIQTPASRDYLLEWVTHKFYASKDMLTTRYGFMPVSINNSPKGLYAWEEHFAKQLLEYNNRREGPIIKFSEEAFWQMQKIYIQLDKWQQLPYFEASVITPFGESKTVESPTLNAQFLNAQKLLYQYKLGIKKAEEIFDIEKLANYYAMLELTHARHGMFWHNHRYYYNPVIDKLEPIAFDGYSNNIERTIALEENFAYKLYDMKEVKPEEKILTDLFLDSTFLINYFAKLEEVTDPIFINSFYNEIADEQMYFDSLIRMEFPNYYFDSEFIKESARSIRNYLPALKNFVLNKRDSLRTIYEYIDYRYTDSIVYQNTPEYFVNAYREEFNEDSILIKVCNYFPKKLHILGTGVFPDYMSSIDIHQNKLQAYYRGAEGPDLEMKADSSSKYLYFMLEDKLDSYVIPINPWPYPAGLTARQELEAETDFRNYHFIERRGEKELVFKTGNYQIKEAVIIPKGYRVYMEAGTKIDFIEGAMFISNSPVYLTGKRNDPIIITSSDFSANAFTVLQAEDRSVIDHVVFENLNTLDYKGWTHTGAVTFYESDVDITNTKFYRNQCEDALNIIRSDFKLQYANFNFIYGDAFDSDFSTGSVLNTEFTNIGNDAIDFSGSEILIEDVQITEAGDKGISGGEDSKLTVKNTNIVRANIGIASKDLSIVKVSNTDIQDCNYGLVLLQKKPEYGPAKMELIYTTLEGLKTKMLIEKGSVLIIDGDIIEGVETNVADLFY